ncbi:MAG: hypothetical protein AB7E59_03875 [Pusillimonas sp.]
MTKPKATCTAKIICVIFAFLLINAAAKSNYTPVETKCQSKAAALCKRKAALKNNFKVACKT